MDFFELHCPQTKGSRDDGVDWVIKMDMSFEAGFKNIINTPLIDNESLDE